MNVVGDVDSSPRVRLLAPLQAGMDFLTGPSPAPGCYALPEEYLAAGQCFLARPRSSKEETVGFPLAELSGDALKSIFENAFFTCRVDEDGDFVVDGDMRVIVRAETHRGYRRAA